jgi:hypothetical protein
MEGTQCLHRFLRPSDVATDISRSCKARIGDPVISYGLLFIGQIRAWLITAEAGEAFGLPR